MSGNLKTLVDMGFSEEAAAAALKASNDDINVAISFLSNTDDAEFDLLATAEPEPQVHPPTVFHPRTESDIPDHFREGSSTVDEMVDSRISSLTSMGFSAERAAEALKVFYISLKFGMIF